MSLSSSLSTPSPSPFPFPLDREDDDDDDDDEVRSKCTVSWAASFSSSLRDAVIVAENNRVCLLMVMWRGVISDVISDVIRDVGGDVWIG